MKKITKKEFLEAAEKGDLSIVKLYVEQGGDIEVKDDNGNTSLILASRKGHLEVVKYLIEKGADVKANSKALVYASWNGHFEVVELLKNFKDYLLRNKLQPSIDKVHKNSSIF
jgi:ankyrin repeat protein